jgi:hypothetical protein
MGEVPMFSQMFFDDIPQVSSRLIRPTVGL